MPIFTKNPPGVGEIVNALVEKYHGAIRDAEVTIDILEARPKSDDNGNVESHALKLHGYPVAATIRIVSYKDRVKGNADAELTVDGESWELLSDAEKDALIDHELEHLELKTDKDGLLIRDDIGRPKLQMRLHDQQFGWFNSIVRRHGDASLESKQLKEFNESRKQLWLPFETEAEAVESARNNTAVKETNAGDDDEDRPLLDGDKSLDVEIEHRGRTVKTTTAKLAEVARGFAGKPKGKAKRKVAKAR